MSQTSFNDFLMLLKFKLVALYMFSKRDINLSKLISSVYIWYIPLNIQLNLSKLVIILVLSLRCADILSPLIVNADCDLFRSMRKSLGKLNNSTSSLYVSIKIVSSNDFFACNCGFSVTSPVELGLCLLYLTNKPHNACFSKLFLSLL